MGNDIERLFEMELVYKVTFETTADQYARLKGLLATLYGEFDIDSYRHRYQVYGMIKK